MILSAGAAALCWVALLLLPWQPWRVREVLAVEPRALTRFDDLRVLIPARNEGALIEGTLEALLAQGEGHSVIVIDDESDDDTAARVARFGDRVQLIMGQPRPSGWTGKLWALEQGVALDRKRPLTLLLDADIRLSPGVLASLRERLANQGGGLVSVMASLRMETFWERLLLPAFIYFFRLLYPFALVNRRHSRVKAAAGGCVLLPTEVIEERRLFRRIRAELIDDCALAREVKASGRPLWLGLSRAVVSERPAVGLGPLAEMVRRTAFTQLGNSVIMLLVCAAMMLLLFAVPWLAIGNGGTAAALGLLAWGAMTLSYLPILRFFDRAPGWALLLPVIGMLYLLFTCQSAFSAWRGRRARWRGRLYATGLES